jgi:SpoVK/Ycf46/Vps4 family AAA+-type ATPase
MTKKALPRHLEVLLADDEPVLDLYAHGPWRVPDGLFEEVWERAEQLNGDPRARRLALDRPDFFSAGTSAVGVELVTLIDYLPGIGAVRSGTRADLEWELFAGFAAEPREPERAPMPWRTSASDFRPPGAWLLTAAGGDQELREVAFELFRDCLDVFTGIVPLEARRRAVISLHDKVMGDAELRARALRDPVKKLPELWASAADADVLAELPELAGPVAHLEWAVSGFFTAHEHLLAVVGTDSREVALGALLLHASLDHVPAGFQAFDDTGLYDVLREVVAKAGEDFDPVKWRKDIRRWLTLCLLGGAADGCRAWLDMAVRVTAAAQGLPGIPAFTTGCGIPTTPFQQDLRQLYRPTKVPNRLVPRLLDRSPARVVPAADRLVGQPELTAALRAAVADATPTRGALVMFCGPEGSGRRTAATLLARELNPDPAIWLHDEYFAGLDASSIVREVKAFAARGRVLVLDGVDRVLGYPSGATVAEELRRQLKLNPGMHVIAVCGPGGDRPLFDANPALYQRFRVAHAREFAEQDWAELFTRAVGERGGVVAADVAATGGVLLSRTPGIGNLRGARLATYLADQCVAAARKRAGDPQPVEVTAADLPVHLTAGALGGATGGGSLADPRAELDACVGLDTVKGELALLVAEERAARLRRAAGIATTSARQHFVFTGGPGTGKTTVARILGRMLAAAGALPAGHLVTVDGADLVAGRSGDVSAAVRRAIERARGGVLCVEDAQALMVTSSDDNRPREATSALLAAVQTPTVELVVVLTGTDAGVNGLLRAEPDLAARFGKVLRFPNLTDEEFVDVFAAKAAAAGFVPGEGVLDRVRRLLAATPQRPPGNARAAVTLLDRTIALQAQRVLADGIVDENESWHEIRVDDVPESLVDAARVQLPADPLAEIDRLIGLGAVKQEVRLLVAEAKAERLRRDAGIPLSTPTRHLVFTGNPGTAKTTVARLVAAAYAKLGLLSAGHVVEVGGTDLIGEYLGQTAPKVRAVVTKALGGVLFIDEAYALAPATHWDDYNREALAELLRGMEEHREDLVVIVAGYSREMARFLRGNPGLASRFPTTIEFPDYGDDELLAIFELMVTDAGFELSDGVADGVRDVLRATPRGSAFGNGRFIRNVLDRTVARQADRLTSTGAGASDEVRLLRPEDLPPVRTEPAGEDVPTGQYL